MENSCRIASLLSSLHPDSSCPQAHGYPTTPIHATTPKNPPSPSEPNPPMRHTLALTLLLASCTPTPSQDTDPATTPIQSPAQAQEVAATFTGLFRHEATIHGDTIITELHLHKAGLQQRRNGFVVFDAPCEARAETRRRMRFECRLEEGQPLVWPLEIDAEGKLFHRAMPEMRYVRAELETP